MALERSMALIKAVISLTSSVSCIA